MLSIAYYARVAWSVEVTDHFETWWNSLSEEEQVSVDGMIRVLETHGASLGSPYSSDVSRIRSAALRQLLVPHGGRWIRVLYVVDDLRRALVLLLGSMAAVDQKCPRVQIELAESIYANYVATRRDEPPQ